MSLWERMRRLLGQAPLPKVAQQPVVVIDPGRTSIATMPAVRGADAVLERAGGPNGIAVTLEEIFVALDALLAQGRAAHALRLGRRALLLRETDSRLALRLAQIAADRGDDDVAAELLAKLTAVDDASVDALMLWGDVLERKNDRVGALAAYERVLARAIDFPRAKERVARLRENDAPSRRADATLLADGALTRGRYRLVRELGRGGAGTVYLADDVHTGRRIALKVYSARGRVQKERLVSEAATAAKLEHAGVVRVLDIDEELMAIAMEWLPSGSVKDLLAEGGLPLARAVGILRSTVSALQFVHASGIVHRDLKPSNLLLRTDDTVVLTDFGLARKIGETPTALANDVGEGTLAYMAPEQRTAAPAQASADVHALGATMREVLAQVSGVIPPPLLAISSACLRTDPAARPTLAAVLCELA